MANYVIPKVEKRDYPFSYRDLSSEKVTSFSPGLLYPLKCWDVLPGDKWNIRLKAAIESLPMIAPVIGKWKASFDFYFEPWENIYGFMDGNYRLGVRQYIEQNRYVMEVGFNYDADTPGDNYIPEDLLDKAVQPGSLLDYMEVPPGFFGKVFDTSQGVSVVPLAICAEDLISYVDIVRNYYVNPQERYALYLATSNGDYIYGNYSIESLDSGMMQIRNQSTGPTLYPLGVGPLFSSIFGRLLSVDVGYKTNCGLFLRTYKMDLLRGIMNDEVGDYESTVQVDEDGRLSITAFRTAEKVQDVINSIDVSGGRFDRVQEMRWGKSPKKHLDRPIYLGSVSKVIGQHDVIATASGVNEIEGNQVPGSVIGQQAGFTVGSIRGMEQAINLNSGGSYGTLMCIFSMVPYVTYSTNIPFRKMKTTFADIFEPQMARLGFQDIDILEMHALPTLRIQKNADGSIASIIHYRQIEPGESVGKRIAWGDYMADMNRAHGRFSLAGDMSYWVMNRVYSAQYDSITDIETQVEEKPDLYGFVDLTTYCKPTLWNHLFQDIRPTADNFRLHVGFDVDVIREIPKRVMPK